MIECVFTIDYEIYGNGEGSLKDLVYDPAERLMEIFRKWDARFVSFIEVAELEMLDLHGADPAIDLVKHQVRELHQQGFELGLHLHPQWCRAEYENGKWLLDYSEYNLCGLPQERIEQIVGGAIAYFRTLLDEPDFTPISFRAGNWLFQPTHAAATVLAGKGIKVDSSVFKGGLQHRHKLDYRRALGNGYFWTFSDQVDVPDLEGKLLEIPIYVQMVPFWKMITAKRIGLEKKGSTATAMVKEKWLRRVPDYFRLSHPLKFDFCRMTINELKKMMDAVIREDEEDSTRFRPIVAVGHTKDLVDLESVESFLHYLKRSGIAVSTFGEIIHRCKC